MVPEEGIEPTRGVNPTGFFESRASVPVSPLRHTGGYGPVQGPDGPTGQPPSIAPGSGSRLTGSTTRGHGSRRTAPSRPETAHPHRVLPASLRELPPAILIPSVLQPHRARRTDGHHEPTLSKPTLLDHTRDRIAQWRKTRPHGNTPMPAALWTAAVAAARRHGLYLTARSLRVDYGALKAHVEASGRGTSTPTFVELTPANGLTAGESIGCVIEVEGRKGTRRTPTERPHAERRGRDGADGVGHRHPMIQLTPQMRILVAVEPQSIFGEASTAWRGCVGRRSHDGSRSLAGSLRSATGGDRPDGSSLMTARASGWRTSVFRAGVFAGGRRVRRPRRRSRPINCNA